MKQRIIRINDISEIDTGKVSVYDLNNRYVDQKGMVYGLRYDRFSRKISIIKLVRAHSSEAATLAHQVQLKKIKANKQPGDGSEEPDEVLTSPDEQYNLDDRKNLIFFDADKFIRTTMASIENHRNRIKGIMKNLKDSNVVSYEDKTHSTQLDDLFRNLEIEGIEKLDKLENYQHELKNYPRSPIYYQARMHQRATTFTEKFNHDSDRLMRFIYNYEIHEAIKTSYLSFQKTLVKLMEFIDEQGIDESKCSTALAKKQFTDAITSVKNTIDEIEAIIDELKIFGDYIYELDTYS